MENYISENIEFLLRFKRIKQQDFGVLFDLGRGVTNQYIQKRSIPKVDTIQKICTYFKITIDDFINRPLTEKSFGHKENPYGEREETLNYVTEPKYISVLEQSVKDKEEIIKGLRKELAAYEDSAAAALKK